MKKGVVKGVDAMKGMGAAEKGRSTIDVAPYSEPAAWLGWHSPYIKESHKKMRLKARAFIQDEIVPPGLDAEETGEHPSVEIYQKMGKVGALAARIGKDGMKMTQKMAFDMEAGLGVKP